jgi:hypothetical protein
MAKSKAAGFRDRIKELRRVPASSLLPNPKNWRTHPQAQQDALRGILSEIGIADAVLARELPDGSLMLIDGHLRAETVADAKVPVLILDVTDSEADKILATLDPLAAMAEKDNQKLADLLSELETENQALQQFMNCCLDDASKSLMTEIVQADAARTDAINDARIGKTEAIDSQVVYINFAFPLTADQERVVRSAISLGKQRFKVTNTGDAVTHILQQWYASSQNEGQSSE